MPRHVLERPGSTPLYHLVDRGLSWERHAPRQIGATPPAPRHRSTASLAQRYEIEPTTERFTAEQRPTARFRIHKRKGRLKRARSTPWHVLDRATGRGWLVNSWVGALELAEAVTR